MFVFSKSELSDLLIDMLLHIVYLINFDLICKKGPLLSKHL